MSNQRVFKHLPTGDIWRSGDPCKGHIFHGVGDMLGLHYTESKDWEEIKKSEWTILTLWSQSYDNKYKGNKCLASYDKPETGSYNKPLNKIYETREKWLEFFHPPLWNIYAVRRESDGEVFTIGDKVNIVTLIETIYGFKLYPDGVFKVLSKGDTQSSCFIETPQKIEKLFTTEDGVDIFKDGQFWTVNTRTLSITTTFPLNEKNIIGKNRRWDGSDGYLQFSTKEAAQQWILYTKQKPILITEDGVSKYVGDTIYGCSKWNSYSHVIKDKDISPVKWWSSLEAIEKYILLNKPCLSINDVFDNGCFVGELALKRLIKSKL